MTVEELSQTTRAELAQRSYAQALDRVRRAELEAELALEALEKATREVRVEARFDPQPVLTPMFETGWQERRVRLMSEQETQRRAA